MPFDKSRSYNPWRRAGVRYIKKRDAATQVGSAALQLARMAPRRPHSWMTKKMTTRIPKGLGNPVAQRTFVWLNYAEVRTLSTGAAGIASDQIYNMNSIFDPDRSGVGHQPYGHDTYQTLYHRYRVHKFKYNVRVTAVNSNVVMSVIPLNNINGNQIQIAEEQTNRIKTHTVGSLGETNAQFAGIVDLAYLNGSSKLEYKADDRFEALFGTSPTELMGLHVILENPSGTVGTVNAIVKLQYYVELTDPIQLAGS